MYKTIKKLIGAFVDFLYPPLCPMCNSVCWEIHTLCSICRGKTSFTRLYYAKDIGLVYLDAVIFLAYYRSGFQLVFNKAKFAGQEKLLNVLENELGIIWQKDGERVFKEMLTSYQKTGNIAVVPVPTDKDRLEQRGYDLPVKIFTNWCKNNGYWWRACLVRVKKTKPQFELSGLERKNNMQQVFSADYLPKEPIIILVDDIMTTGATLVDCARALRQLDCKNNRLIVGLALASDTEK